MKDFKIAEVIAVCLSLVGIVGATVIPFHHEAESVKEDVPPGAQVVTLTGVAEAGAWTEDEVRGGNYWNSSFRPARPVLQAGRPVLFRLKSADVVHLFYSPGLGVGPVEVYPGHVEEVSTTPEREGVFGYYCTTMCGDPHFAMRGVVIVQGDAGSPEASSSPSRDRYWLKPPPPPDASLVERGEWLFNQKGCVTCHGPAGEGGVPNMNYVNDTVPALSTLARKMFLFFPEDVNAIVGVLERHESLESLEDSPPVRRFAAVLAQYRSIKGVVRKGSAAGKKDPNGPYPPLEMPAWEYRLSDQDIDSIIAYLLTQNPRQGGDE